jgi:beta-lactamase superfamily II metal-dependent hydrolase
MKIKIFDVDFGFSALIVDDAQESILVGCSWSYNKEFIPTYITKNTFFGIERLIVSTYKEQHLAELSNFLLRRPDSPFPFIVKNPTIDLNYAYEQQLRDASPNLNLKLLADKTDSYVICNDYVTTSGVQFQFFWNNYPDFLSMDSLSLVTFMSYQDTHILFAGDLDRAGWLSLLQRNEFQEKLRKVNFFVASHSGQEQGYCSEVFDYCQPDLVLVSNNINRPISEDILRRYKNHAKGFQYKNDTYYLINTSQVGAIRIQISKNTRCEIKNLEPKFLELASLVAFSNTS